MPSKTLPYEVAAKAVSALKEHLSITKAAQALGVPRSTLQTRLRTAQAIYGLSGETPGSSSPQAVSGQPPLLSPAPTPREIKDTKFWQRKYEDAERRAVDAERVAEHLAGIRKASFNPPVWAMKPESTDRRGRSVIGALVSDMHMGEVIEPNEILGVNSFNPDICRARMRRYFDAVCAVGARWSSDTICEGALLALNGDLTSGSIHEELAMTNALTSPEQALAAAEVLGAGALMLAEAFGRVHIVGTPGNHGRTTLKPTAKLYARLSYDIMIVAMLADRFKADKRFTFQYGESKDQIVPIFGRTVHITHGDKIGTKGGMGFAGPNLPIVRGTKKIEAQQARFGRRPDLILTGHYHTTSNPGIVLANGSVPGYGEYADDLRADPEPPQQWLFLLHNKWWLRERAAIQLEEPGPLEPLRVRVPAVMANAI